MVKRTVSVIRAHEVDEDEALDRGGAEGEEEAFRARRRCPRKHYTLALHCTEWE